jgi:hypothetical protein
MVGVRVDEGVQVAYLHSVREGVRVMLGVSVIVGVWVDVPGSTVALGGSGVILTVGLEAGLLGEGLDVID